MYTVYAVVVKRITISINRRTAFTYETTLNTVDVYPKNEVCSLNRLHVKFSIASLKIKNVLPIMRGNGEGTNILWTPTMCHPHTNSTL